MADLGAVAGTASFDGAVVRLICGAGRSLAPAPGQPGRDGVAGAILFEAGRGIFGLDLFTAFWGHEAAGMDWLADFLCDPEMDALISALSKPEEHEEEEEILYSKRQLVTLGSDVMDEY